MTDAKKPGEAENGFAVIKKKIPVGAKFVSPMGRTITEGDISLLSSLTWIINPLHFDKEFTKKTRFGQMILPGAVTLAIVQGFSGITGIRQLMYQEGMRTAGLLGYEDVRLLAPVKAGDTLRVESEVAEVRPTSKPNQAIIKVKEKAFNQDGILVIEFLRVEIEETI